MGIGHGGVERSLRSETINIERIGSGAVDAFPHVSRRQVILGAAGTLLLAACGKSDSGDDTTESSETTVAGQGGILALLSPPEQPVGVPLRIPLGLADKDGSFDVDLPSTARLHLRGPNGATSAPMTVQRHDLGLPRGYFPLRTTFEEAGRWTIVLEAGKRRVETTLDVKPASELPAVTSAGDPLPRIATPTTANHQGVDPICTRDPVCPFHGESLDQVIGGSKPIVLLVSTPAFCQVAICGPVLDLLVKRRASLAEQGFAVIHAEVYTDDTAKATAPTVDALGLTYEPALFLAAPDGTVTDRLDAIFDSKELDDGLARLLP